MKLRMISFTKNGWELSKIIQNQMQEWSVSIFTKCSYCKSERLSDGQGYVEESLEAWTAAAMKEKNGLIFIGACGIAIRAIAPSVKNKLVDSPVLVIDERGQFVIPILSGHVGGANALAKEIAGTLGAQAVITTATDLQHKFSIDMFAKKNHLMIQEKEGIAKISSKILAGEEVQISVEKNRVCQDANFPKEVKLVSYPPQGFVDVVITESIRQYDTSLTLRAKPYVFGIGCRKGKTLEELRTFFYEMLQEQGIRKEQVGMLVSVDRKREEEGLLLLSKEERIPFHTYTAKELEEVEGVFTGSQFVKEIIGVDSVCERSAMKACDGKGSLLCRKKVKQGMTGAIAKKEWRITWDEE